MVVRVFDNQRNTYFRSGVFAIINSGWYEKRLVVVPSDNGNYFKFFDYIDRSTPTVPKVLINVITSDELNPNIKWIHQRIDEIDKKLSDYAKLLDDDIRFFEYRGYSWIYENRRLLTELLNGGKVSTTSYEHQMPDSSTYQLEGWHYVDKQQDIDFLFEQTSGFHDSVLKEMTYLSGAYVDDKNNMHCTDSVRQVTMRFDSQWCRSIEMVFEGVTTMNLRPYSDNESSYLYDASLFIQNETIYFFDSQIIEIDNFYEGTWIASYGLRWRFYGEISKKC